jgi:hypothetical protein
MSTDNEREIRGRLDAALGIIDPPGPPVNAVLRRGRSIRLRRRAAVAAGLAAVVGLGIALPGLIGHVRAAPTLQHTYRVTVNPVRDTPGKLVFSGTFNRKPWQFDFQWNKGNVMQDGPAVSSDDMGDLPLDGQLGWFNEGSNGSGADAELMVMGRVGQDVSRLALNEPDGQTINLYPARWHGQRWTGVMIPAHQTLRSVVAYSGRRELGYAIPFRDNTINNWLKPGQHGLARQQARIAAGVLNGRRWRYEGYAGPWGICFRGSPGGGSCGARQRPVHLLNWLSCGSFDGSGSTIWSGQTPSDVSYLKFGLSDGSVQRVASVSLAGNRYFALVYGGHRHLTGWTAYGTLGQVLGSGSVSPKC